MTLSDRLVCAVDGFVQDWVFRVLSGLCGPFWTLPFALKLARDLFVPALVSFAVLAFISFFGSGSSI